MSAPPDGIERPRLTGILAAALCLIAAGCGSDDVTSVRPPPASLEEGGATVTMTLGGYCWAGDGVGVCADGGERACGDAESPAADATIGGTGGQGAVRLGFEPRTAVADAAGQPLGAVVSGSDVVLAGIPTPGTAGLILRLVATAEQGDAAYWACLRPASP